MEKLHVSLRRLLSLCMVLALLFASVPGGLFSVSAMDAEDLAVRVADNSTMDDWKNYFGEKIQIEGKSMTSTEYSGAVWTDKSVFTDASAFRGAQSAMGNTVKMSANQDSFLVALSAIASSKSITGYSYLPTDTMLILDVSGSMEDNGCWDDMVDAANEAIEELLSLNKHNRVGVVLYSGNSKVGNSSTSTATLVLPLDRYTTRNATYLYANDETVSVSSSVRSETTGEGLPANSKSVIGGTYIQNGIIKAAGELLKADTMIEEGFQAGTSRIPILVLMSDGAPTAATTNYTNPGTSTMGDGTATNDRIGFVTQLTAAYAKASVEKHYGRSSLFYTLGLGLDQTSGSAVAKSVMWPASNTQGMESLWRRYLALDNGDSMYLQGNNGQTVTKNSAVTAAYKTYVTEFFKAEEGKEMSLEQSLTKAFGEIVDEIILQSLYYPTLAESGDYVHDGYVTIRDDLGNYMEVVDVKGLTIGNTFYCGEAMASAFVENGSLGSVENPTAMGDEFIWSVQTRLGISNADARSLVTQAFNNKQLFWESASNYSNYIGWYADANGNYLSFWHPGVTTQPANAAYTVKSYGFLGVIDNAAESMKDTDMMYVTVQVRTNLATGTEQMFWRIPAALIPMVVYQVTMEAESFQEAVEEEKPITLEYHGAEPIRLLYEVGLRSDIHSWNISEKVTNSMNTPENNGGYYTFYSNAWRTFHVESDEHPSQAHNAASQFEPSEENERYYYNENTPVYVKDGNGYKLYSGSSAPTGECYRAYWVVGQAEGSAAFAHLHYERINDISLAAAKEKLDDNKRGTGEWYIPKGTIHRLTTWAPNEKDTNRTGSLSFAQYPVIEHATGSHYYVTNVLGNNGLLKVKSATGIRLDKTVDVPEPGASNLFTFVISGGTPEASYRLIRVSAAGTEKEDGTHTFDAEGKATVVVPAGEAVYIIDLEGGKTYTVTEAAHADYKVKAISGDVSNVDLSAGSADVAVQADMIHTVSYVNTPKAAGEVNISKIVTHPFGATYQLPEKEFPITVTFEGASVPAKVLVQKTGGEPQEMTVVSGVLTGLTLKHGEAIRISGDELKEGTVVTVEETLDSAAMPGFTVSYKDSESGTTADPNGEQTVVVADDATVWVEVQNAYTPGQVSPVNITLKGTKALEGRDWKDNDSFTFKLQRLDGADWTTLAEASVSAAGKTFDFTAAMQAEIYEQVGTYSYRVIEEAGSLGGVTYDDAVHHFNVVIVDEDMDGKLEIKEVVSILGASITSAADEQGNLTWNIVSDFVNRYAAHGSAAFELDLTKALTSPYAGQYGVTLPLDGYEFELYSDNGTTPDALDAADTLVATATTGADGKATLRHVLPGEPTEEPLVFFVREANTGLPGVSYSQAVMTIRVTVTDDQMGNHITRIEYVDAEGNVISDETGLPTDESSDPVAPSLSFTFTNTYAAEPVTAEITGTKTLTGRTMQDGEFTFKLMNGSAEIDSATNTDGSFTLSATFGSVGVYTYTVVEVNGGSRVNGVYYDDTVYTVTFTVTDNGSGKLQVAAPVITKGDSAAVIAFANTYTADPTSAVIEASKTLTGKDLKENEFTFELLDASGNPVLDEAGNPLRATNGADGVIRFPAISYTAEGTHTYKIREVGTDGDGSGIDYDETVYTVTVTVTDNGTGELSAVVSKAASELVFRNSYKAAPADTSFTADKELTGRTLINEEFSFTLYKASFDGTNWTKGEKIETVKNGDNGNFAFSTLTYYTAGDYYYWIEEDKAGTTENGVHYDDTVFYIHVEVEDNWKGKLEIKDTVITSSKSGGEEVPIIFNNTYTVTGDGELTLGGTKTLTGRTGKAMTEGEFTFTVREGNEVVATGKSMAADAGAEESTVAIVFTTIDYSAEDIGDHVYVITEDVPNGDKAGITYSTVSYTVKVNVADNGLGGLTVTVTEEPDAIAFTNTYAAEGTASIVVEGTKTLTGKTASDADQFTFKLMNGAEVVDSVVSGTGSFRLGATFDAAGTYTYTVVEEKAGETIDGITYDDEVYTVTVTVSDNGEGGLTAAYVIKDSKGNQADKAVFENTYKTDDTKVEIGVDVDTSKTLSGRVMNVGEFSFSLYEADENWANVNSEPKETVQNEEDGSFRFTALNYDAEGDFYYVVKEVNGGETISGVTYDDEVFYIHVSVRDNGKGKLIATVSMKTEDGTAAEEIAFNNSYAVTEPVTMLIGGTKALTGRDLKEGEFTFVLTETDQDGNALEGGVTRTAANKVDADDATKGSFIFDAIEYRKPGTYYYTVAESAADAKAGITYDDTVYTVVVTLVDNGDGTMTASVDKTAADIAFENSYEIPDDVSLDVIAKKTVKNIGELSIGPEDFRFQIVDQESGEIITATSDKDGIATMTLHYTWEDLGKTFTYRISEINMGKQFITYSTTVYEIQVTIELDEETNTLKTVVTNNGRTMRSVVAPFENIYDKDKKDVPDTGDNTNLALWIGLTAVAGAAVVILLVTRKGKKKDAE